MSITQDQFEQLNEMGISLWQRRACDKQDNTTAAPSVSYLAIDLSELANQQLFNDILLAAGLSIGEVNLKGDHLDLGLFNWYFTPIQPSTDIQWLEQQLITPSIPEIAKSPVLKKQLWQVLSKQAQ